MAMDATQPDMSILTQLLAPLEGCMTPETQ